MLRGFKGKQGACLRHTIAYGIRKADFAEPALYLPAKWGAADDYCLKPASEGLEQLLTLILVEGDPEVGDACRETGKLGKDLGLVQLLHYQRHSDHKAGLDFSACLYEEGRRRELSKEPDGKAGAAWVDELHCKAVHVGQGKHGNKFIRGVGELVLALLHNV